jgi:photosystem II stability/assembly factor-like uncharacterized protein
MYSGIKNISLLLFSTFLCLFSACEKDNRDYKAEMHLLPTELDLTDICFVNADTGFVTAGSLFTGGLVLRTVDAGLSWDTVMVNNQGTNSVSFQNNILTVSECGNKLHYTSDFINWSFSTTSEWWRWHNHVRLPNNNVFLVGGGNFDLGIIHKKDAAANNMVLKDSIDTELMDIEYTADGNLFVVGYGLVKKSADEADSWHISNVKGDFFRGIDFPSADIGYVVGEYGSVYKTTDKGDSWTLMRAANSIFADETKLFRDIVFADENSGLILGTGNLMFSTYDGGKTWKEVENPDGFADFTAASVYNNKIYLCGKQGKLLILDLNS